MRNTRLSKGALLVALLAAGTAIPSFAQEGPLRIRLNADIRSTQPGVNRDANTDGVVMNIVEGLVGYRDDTSIAPLLAETINVSEDGTVYTFTLRDGITFSNGEPLTSAEVLSSWAHYTQPDSGWRCLPDVNGEGVANVVNVEAPDASTVVFTLENPTALFLATLARADCGGTGIFHESSIDTDGNWIAPIGTGPFALGEWRTGQYVDLVKNEHYSALEGGVDGYVGNKTPLVDAVRFLVIPDDSAAKAALYAGDIDIISDVNNADVPEFSSSEQVQFEIVPGMGIVALLFQTRDPLLQDVRVREALQLSLDLDQLAEVVSEGLAEASTSVIPQPSAYFGAAQAEVPARDIEKAKALLADAGYNGQPIKWLTTEFYPNLFDAAVLVQAMALEAGINIEIETLDWATLLDRYTTGDFSAMSFSYSARLDPSLSFDMVSGNKDEQPNKVWDNAEGREIMAEAARISDSGERQSLFDKLEGMIRADVPLIVLYSGTKGSASRQNVEGYKSWSVGLPRAWGVSLTSEK